MIDPGGPAPDFTLSDQDGEPVSLSSLRGRWVALYFYPKADTPGCTKQACGVRDHSADYEAANAVVLGISPDPVDELRAFADKYGLAFTLLSDEDHIVADAYGVWDELQFGDLKVWGNHRSTALIDPDGRVAAVFPDVRPDEHDQLLLGALGELRAAAPG
jgi:peroxiredoxin Q/BCP